MKTITDADCVRAAIGMITTMLESGRAAGVDEAKLRDEILICEMVIEGLERVVKTLE